jgi:hypothetical protein
MREGAGSREMLIEDEAIGTIDRFALQRRLPNGKTVLDQFLVSWPDLGAADRDMLRLARPGGRDLRDPPQGPGLAHPAEPR